MTSGALLLLCISIIYTLGFNFFINSSILSVTNSDISRILNWSPRANTYIFDKDGVIISELYNSDHSYVKFNQIPGHLVDAIVAIEDQNFFEHNGIDLIGIIRASLVLIKNNQFKFKQGASTITQQVVRSLLLTKEKTLFRKIREIALSVYLEKKISKEKIFEIYSNIMFMGNGAYGVASASKRYFNKSLNKLNIHESALLAGLFQLPSHYNPSKYPKRALKRQKIVLKAMLKTKKISQENFDDIINEKLNYTDYKSSHGKIAPYFVDYIINKSSKILNKNNMALRESSLKIYTTLDQNLQKMAEEAMLKSKVIFNFARTHMNDDINKNIEKDKVEAAILSIDHSNGNIVAMVGGRDYSKNQFNRAISSKRAPGSLFKSITYSYALEEGKKWNDLHYISPLTVGNYRPHTSRHDLLTETTMLNAFSKSINSVAVELGVELGIKRVISHAKRLGMNSELRNEASTLLGASEVSMLDISNVYSTFANKGINIEPIAITKIENNKGEIIYEAKMLKARSRRAISKINSELICEGLKQVVKTGTAYRARSMSNYIAGKTGTSNLSKDNWFAGFSKNITTVAWIGSDNQTGYNYKVSASTVAVPLWKNYMKSVLKLNGNRPLEASSSLTKIKVNYDFGNIDDKGLEMYFSPFFLPKKRVNLDIEYLSKGKNLRLGL